MRSLQDRLAGGARFHESMGDSFVPDALLKDLGIGFWGGPQVGNGVAGFTKLPSRLRRAPLFSVG